VVEIPVKWFVCPDGEQIEIIKCLDSDHYDCRMKRRCASRQYLNFISQERPRKYLCPKCRKELLVTLCPDCNIEAIPRFSTTQLINGTMSAFLKLTEDYAIAPDARAFMAHGTKAHSALETSGDDLSILEERLEMNDITGIADALEEENGELRLIDTKTSGSYKIAKALGLFTYDMRTGEVYKSGPRKGEPKTVKGLKFGVDNIDMVDWEMQLNAYRLMYLENGYKIDKMYIMAVVRDGGSRSALSRGIVKNTYMIPVKIMADDVVRDYFNDKKIKLLQALEQGYWTEACNEVENWAGNKCKKYCEVWEHCSMGRIIHEQKDEEDEDMPVGYTNNIRIQNGGRIKLGEIITNENGKEQTIEFSYFRLEPKTQDVKERERLITEFEAAFGKDPTTIEAMLPWGLKSNNVEEILGTEDNPDPNFENVFPQNYYRTSHKSGLTLCSNARMPIGQAKCIDRKYTNDQLEVISSKKITYPKNPQANREECMVRCLMEDCPFRNTEPYAQCVPTAFLNVMIPKINSMDNWTIKTGSYNSICNINGFLAKTAFMLSHTGIYSVSGVPIRLERRPQKMNHAGTISEHYPIFVDSQQEISISKFLEMATKSKDEVKRYIGMEMPKMLEAEDGNIIAEDAGIPELPPSNATTVVDGDTGEVLDQSTEPPMDKPEDNVNDQQDLSADMLPKITRDLAKVINTQVSSLTKYSLQIYKEPFDAVIDFNKALHDPDYLIALNEKFSTWIAATQDNLFKNE